MKNKATSIIKKYFFLLALVAMVGGFSAFKFTDTEKTMDGLHWFEVDENNQFGNPLSNGSADLPGISCENDNILQPLCAVGLTDAQVDSGGSPTIPSPLAADEENKRYRNE